MTKGELRKAALALRKRLGADEVTLRNLSLHCGLGTFLDSRSEIKVVHSFIAIPGRNEPDILTPLFQRNLNVCSPVSDPATGTFRQYIWSDPTTLVKGPYGILEPPRAGLQPIPPAEVDLYLVPALLVNAMGQRIGYGAGYYDRFLGQPGIRGFKLAVGLLPITGAEWDYDNFDVPVDGYLSPAGLTLFSNYKGAES